jgi:hypothetical protein
MSIVDQLYFNYILLYIGGCRVILVGGYVWARYSYHGSTSCMINSLYISSHHIEIGFIDFIVINFNEVGSHREFIFKSLNVLLA